MAVTLASAWRFFWQCNVAGESETKPVDPVVRGCAAEPRNLLADGSCISRFGEQLLLSGHGAEHILCTLWLLIWKYSAPPPLRRAAMGEKHDHHHPIFCNSALPFVTDVLLSCLIKTSTSSAAPYPSQQLWCSSVVPGGVVRRLGPVLVLGWPPRRLPPSPWEEPPRAVMATSCPTERPRLQVLWKVKQKTITAPSCRENFPGRMTSAYWAFQPGQDPL